MVLPGVQNVFGNLRRPAGHTNANVAQRLTKDEVVLLHHRTCLIPSWCGASRIIRDFWKPWHISSLYVYTTQ